MASRFYAFAVYDAPVDDGGAPLTTATPTFAVYRPRRGARTAPSITHLGGGVYGFTVPTSDMQQGVAFLIETGAYPANIVGNAGGSIQAFAIYDGAGVLLPGQSPTFATYRDADGAALPAPAIQDFGEGLYAFTVPTDDFATGVGFEIDCGTGNYPPRVSGFAQEEDASALINVIAPAQDLSTSQITTLDRAAQYIKDKPNFRAFISAFTAQFDTLESMFADLKTAFAIDTAVGDQLDVVGRIVGQPRDGRTDALYRPALYARIIVNKSSGTIEELLAIATLMVPGATVVSLDEYPPASFVLRVFGHTFTDDEFAQVVEFIRSARAAGIGGSVHGSFASIATTFTLDGTSAQALDNGLLSGTGS
jgi:hypothetical protein